MSVHLNAIKYTPFSVLWHIFLSGVFSMQLSVRYIFSASPPGTTILPITNLSSLWCKVMFKWLIKAELYNPLPLPVVWIFTLVLFCLPFGLRLAAQQNVGKESGWNSIFGSTIEILFSAIGLTVLPKYCSSFMDIFVELQ